MIVGRPEFIRAIKYNNSGYAFRFLHSFLLTVNNNEASQMLDKKEAISAIASYRMEIYPAWGRFEPVDRV